MKLVIGSIFISLLLLSGCAEKSFVKIVDNKVEKYVEVQEVKERIRDDGLMEIQINAQNETDEYKLFKYRVDWQDKDGFLIPSLSSKWADFPAHKNSNFKINVIAPSPKATAYQVYLSE